MPFTWTAWLLGFRGRTLVPLAVKLFESDSEPLITANVKRMLYNQECLFFQLLERLFMISIFFRSISPKYFSIETASSKISFNKVGSLTTSVSSLLSWRLLKEWKAYYIWYIMFFIPANSAYKLDLSLLCSFFRLCILEVAFWSWSLLLWVCSFSLEEGCDNDLADTLLWRDSSLRMLRILVNMSSLLGRIDFMWF